MVHDKVILFDSSDFPKVIPAIAVPSRPNLLLKILFLILADHKP